jgi:hypothetical protein
MGGGELHIELNGKPITNRLFITSTGGGQQFKTFTFNDVFMPEGIHQLRLVVDKGEMNLDQARISERFPTSLPEVDSGAGFFIYPNPASEYIHLKYPSGQSTMVYVNSLEGQVVRVAELSPDGSRVLSLHGLPAGTYIVSGTIDDKLYRSKLIKLK